MSKTGQVILWWGRSDSSYSRNRIVRACLKDLGCQIVDFSPKVSFLADIEAMLRKLPCPDLVWVPCFRQRDLAAASRWAHRHQVPLIFDPLISAYDKKVLEQQRYSPKGFRARRLLNRESSLFACADLLLADTEEHARFFRSTFCLEGKKIEVLPVGAEENLFCPRPKVPKADGEPIEVLFFGSFIGLQAPQLIVDAARIYTGPPVRWRLVGNGPLYEECRRRGSGIDSVCFEPWVAYEQLADTICSADLVLGIFGVTDKASRVIPNKVYQGLACGKPLVTRLSPAYPPALLSKPSGIEWVEPGSAQAIAAAVARLAQDSARLAEMGELARKNYDEHFSLSSIREKLGHLLVELIPADKQG